jgi:FAD/FMN-containing dehydrogenase
MKHADAKMGKKVAKKAAKEEVSKHVKAMHAEGGKVKIRGTGAATKGIYARGPMA